MSAFVFPRRNVPQFRMTRNFLLIWNFLCTHVHESRPGKCEWTPQIFLAWMKQSKIGQNNPFWACSNPYSCKMLKRRSCHIFMRYGVLCSSLKGLVSLLEFLRIKARKKFARRFGKVCIFDLKVDGVFGDRKIFLVMCGISFFFRRVLRRAWKVVQ